MDRIHYLLMSVLFFSNCHTDPAISAASSSHHNHRNMPVRVLENTAAPSSQVSGANSGRSSCQSCSLLGVGQWAGIFFFCLPYLGPSKGLRDRVCDV
ncbi:hypothetical protein JHK87_001176 [Glycine soja]|uniref:Uncharacterized protein n=1 Tax=Glycine max TaxID=3847 RepID=A0A0R0LI89_SOYBN|nr:hypothetical protein JHK87_001176 [Glycine soja]